MPEMTKAASFFMAAMICGKAFCSMVENRLATTRSPCWDSEGFHLKTSSTNKSSCSAVTALRTMLCRATSMAMGSKSKAVACSAPSLSAAIASTAVPQPMSVMLHDVFLRDLAASQMKRRQVDVVAWSPVPKAISAGTLRMQREGNCFRRAARFSGELCSVMTSASLILSGGRFSRFWVATQSCVLISLTVPPKYFFKARASSSSSQ